jgi:prevent-host-death family protein
MYLRLTLLPLADRMRNNTQYCVLQLAREREAMSARKKPMQVQISSTNAQRQFGEVMRRAYSGEEHIVVQQNGLSLVVMLSINEYDELMKERELREEREKRAEVLSRKFGEEAQRRGITEEQLLENLNDTNNEVYQERYGKSRKS